MINKININPIQFKGYSNTQQSTTNPTDKQPKNFKPGLYVDKEYAEAIKNYTLVANPAEINMPISMQDYIKKLTKGGLIEGKDFTVTDDGVYIDRGGDKCYKAVYWFDGNDADHFSGYTDISYPINKEPSCIRKSYDRDGILETRQTVFDNPESHKDLFPKNVTDVDMKVSDYLAVLEQKGIKYEVLKDAEYTDIREYDENDKLAKRTTFGEFRDSKLISQSNYPEKDGGLFEEVTLYKDRYDSFYELTITEHIKELGIKKEKIKY